MRVLVVGGGAREHALVARIASERDAGEVVCAPGNPGIATLARTLPVDLTSPDAILDIADREAIDFTIVGPELPLSTGVADRFAEANRLLLGPTASAARLESSKTFAKSFMTRHGVPTAPWKSCDSLEDAFSVIRDGTLGFPVVLKADGLAAGKGVVIADDRRAAEAAILSAMRDRHFGAAGERLVIEECLHGVEVSSFFLCDGTTAVSIGTAQDHKRVLDDDRGPNTGGMGAFAPSPLVDDVLATRIETEIVKPVVCGMLAEGCPFRGFLYVGLMLTSDGPKVIEFNVRLGDPEAQVVLPSIEGPILPALIASALGELKHTAVRVRRERHVGVVLASRGYPESSESGREILGIDRAEALADVVVYHAGTKRAGGRIVTAGGRVLTVVGSGAGFEDAIARAYAGVREITFDGMQYRRDIGRKALEGEQ